MEQVGKITVSLESLGLKMTNAPPIIFPQQKPQAAALPSLQKSYVFISDIDNDDSSSIVVLGKSSLDEIQARSLADYEESHQKSMAVDYKCIISNLSPIEIEEQLTQVLQDNLRLKEALEKSNQSMKQHLSALVSRQEELAKVHETHKQKFAETKNLISALKTENSEFKAKLERHQKDYLEQSTQTEKAEETSSFQIFEKSNEEEISILAEKCEQQNQEIAHMNKVVASLKEQLVLLHENSCNTINFEDSAEPGTSGRANFVENFTHYNEKLRTLGNCYIAQTSRYTNVQEYLRRCSDMLEEKIDAGESEESRKSMKKAKCKELQEIRGKLVDEELKTIFERQQMIKAHNEFQKMFTNYNATVLEIESLRKEIEHASTLEKAVSLDTERLDEARADLRKTEWLLEQERHSLKEAWNDLAKQKSELEKERSLLQSEKRTIIEANVSSQEEVASLREMNQVLRTQINVYENDWADHMKHLDNMRTEKTDLLQQMEKLQKENAQLASTLRYIRHHPID